MNKLLFFALGGLLCILLPKPVPAASLDEMYRDIVRSDNQGYLPVFVKNRSLPELFIEEEILKKLPPETRAPLKEPVPEPVNLTDERARREAEAKAAQKRWDDAVRAVAANQVTPLVLEEISRKVAGNDPKAVEILAYMNARGLGIKPNLIRAFELYDQAARLGVPQAADNAKRVWRAMNNEQRTFYKETH